MTNEMSRLTGKAKKVRMSIQNSKTYSDKNRDIAISTTQQSQIYEVMGERL